MSHIRSVGRKSGFGPSALSACALWLLAGATPFAQGQPLQAGTPVTATIAPGQVHNYTVRADAGQAFTVVVEQQGSDLVLTVRDPSGQMMTAVDNSTDDAIMRGKETLNVRVATGGDYQVAVTTFDRIDNTTSPYAITLMDVRALAPAELTDAKAEAEIRFLDRDWRDAVARRDTLALSKLAHPNLVRITESGASGAVGRDQYFANIERLRARPNAGSLSIEVQNCVTRVVGDTALATGSQVATISRDGRSSLRLLTNFVRVWSRGSNGWSLVSSQDLPFGRLRTLPTSPPSIPSSVLSQYVGRYVDEEQGFTVLIEQQSGLLTHQTQAATGVASPTRNLKALSEVTFEGGAREEYTFVRSSAGTVTELIRAGAGSARHLKKVS